MSERGSRIARVGGACGLSVALVSTPVLAAASEGALPQLNPDSYPGQLFWLALTFGVLLLLLWRVALPRVSETLRRREERIANDLRQAEGSREEAEKIRVTLESDLAAARAAARAVLARTAAELAAEQARRLQGFETDMAKQARDAAQRIVTARDAALADARTAAGDIARLVVQRLSGDGDAASSARAGD